MLFDAGVTGIVNRKYIKLCLCLVLGRALVSSFSQTEGGLTQAPFSNIMVLTFTAFLYLYLFKEEGEEVLGDFLKYTLFTLMN